MPELIWLYLTALLYYRTSASCMALVEALQTMSHDRLTRMLQADWPGQTLLELAFRTLFVWERGVLILDDTVIPKPFATAMEGLAWVFSSQERQPVYGFSLVLLVWTNGTLRIPLGLRLWRRGGPSKYELALELLSYARNRRRCHPEYVLFDGWYPSKALLKRIRDYGWYFVCRLKKNRRFNGQPLRAYRRHPYWAETGWLTGGLKVLVVRHGAKYSAANRLMLPAAEVRRLYRLRSQIEEVLRLWQAPNGPVGQRSFQRFLLLSKGAVTIDHAKAAVEGRYDGIFVLRTNTTLPAAEVAVQYRRLLQVEQFFRTAKSLLALMLVHELQRCLSARGWQFEWEDIRRDLAALVEMEVRDGEQCYGLRRVPQGVAGEVLPAVGVAIPPRVRPLLDMAPSPEAIGNLPVISHAQVFGAQEQGWPAELGVNHLEFLRFPSGTPFLQAMAAGQVDGTV